MISFLTDFGTADYFVAAVKGVIHSLHPAAQVIDITHQIPAHDIHAAAFTLGACYRDFPQGTIHLAIVDPEVGSTRRHIVVATAQHLFVGPDNGIFSYVYAREKHVQVFHIRQTEFFRPTISATFHGRDIFAPITGWLAKGVAPASLGQEIFDYVRFEIPTAKQTEQGIQGEILYLDQFGNCITNLTTKELSPTIAPQYYFQIGTHYITQIGTHFAEAATNQLFAYPGSAGYWEIALKQQSAAQQMGILRKEAVIVRKRSDDV